MIRVSIRYNLPADAVPAWSILSGEPEFEITGNVYPVMAASREEDRHGGDAEIIKVRRIVVACGYLRRACRLEKKAFEQILESNMPLRHSIEDLLRAQAQSDVEQK